MIEMAASISAGLGVLVAVLAVGAPDPGLPVAPWVWRALQRRWAIEKATASDTGWVWLDARTLVGTATAVTNFSHCNVADAEIRAARIESDPAKQKALWKSAQEKIIKAVCAVPVYEQLQLWAWKDTLDLGYPIKGSLNLSPPITEKTRFTK